MEQKDIPSLIKLYELSGSYKEVVKNAIDDLLEDNILSENVIKMYRCFHPKAMGDSWIDYHAAKEELEKIWNSRLIIRTSYFLRDEDYEARISITRNGDFTLGCDSQDAVSHFCINVGYTERNYWEGIADISKYKDCIFLERVFGTDRNTHVRACIDTKIIKYDDIIRIFKEKLLL